MSWSKKVTPFNDEPAVIGFCNFRLPRKGTDKTSKMCYFPLNEVEHKELAELLSTEEGVERFRKALIIDFHTYSAEEKASGFDI